MVKFHLSNTKLFKNGFLQLEMWMPKQMRHLKKINTKSKDIETDIINATQNHKKNL